MLWALLLVPAGAGSALLLPVLVGHPRAIARITAGVAVSTSGAALVLAILVAVRRPAVAVAFVAGGDLALRVDGLAALLAVAVASVTLFVLVFAAGEPRDAAARFFGLMLLFEAAVLTTVTAASLPALLLGWEVMGAMSYALIAFRWQVPGTAGSGTTAFLTTRAGDLGLYLAAGAALAGAAGPGALRLDALTGLPPGWRDLAAAGVLAAALGKAAQLPFAFWLSRAMVGPSPVSALLHSAAMVAMGGYLLLRLQPLLSGTTWAPSVTSWVGASTALVLGAVALAQRDLKQLLAASTSAQLGYVILAAGTGAVAAGAGHLVAHAATKALLFLAAGAWLTALGSKDLRALRGAARRYPTVGVAFAVGALSLAGIPPLSLWITKDEVLAPVREQSLPLYLVGLAGAVLSALYAGKALALVSRPFPDRADGADTGYDTEQRGTRHVGALERMALLALAAASAVLGVVAVPGVGPQPVRASAGELALSALLAAVALAVALAAPHRLPRPARLRSWLGLEQLAHAVVVRPTLAASTALARFDDDALHRAVTGAAAGVCRAARAADRLDRHGLDAAVGALGRAVAAAGRQLRRPQTGLVHHYVAQATAGLALAVAVLLLVVR